MAVAAADVGDRDAGLELLHHAIERRQPLRHEARAVAVAVERRRAAGEAPVMLAPGDALAGAEGLERLRLVEPHRRRHVPGVRDVDRAVLVGQHHRLLGQEFVGVAHAVIGDIAAGRLRVQPFAHVALGAAGPRGDFLGAQRSGAGHRLVEAELAAEADHHAGIAGRQVADGARGEGLEPRLVDLWCIQHRTVPSPV